MTVNDWTELEQLAKDWTREAGELLKESLHTTRTVETKSNADDLVTEMDRSIEQFFFKKIKARFPDHFVLGEEGSGDEVQSDRGTIWIIDPIDGTTNFVHQKFNFAVSVAVYHDGIGKVGLVYNVMGDELFLALEGKGAFLNGDPLPKLEDGGPVEEAIIGLNAGWIVANNLTNPKVIGDIVHRVRGVRSYGAASIEIAYVAANRLDAYISLGLSPWDFAAGLILLKEVGGVASTFTGNDLNILKSSSVFVAKPSIHQDMVSSYIKGR